MDKKNGVLRIVIGDPTDIDTIDALKFRLNTKIETCLGARSKIKQHIDKLFAEENASIDLKGGGPVTEDDAPIIKLVSAMITNAVQARASDIHIEPMQDRVRVRY